MARKCSASEVKSFELVDAEIGKIYNSRIKEWANGGAYVPIPKGYQIGTRVYVVVQNG